MRITRIGIFQAEPLYVGGHCNYQHLPEAPGLGARPDQELLGVPVARYA